MDYVKKQHIGFGYDAKAKNASGLDTVIWAQIPMLFPALPFSFWNVHPRM